MMGMAKEFLLPNHWGQPEYQAVQPMAMPWV